MTKHSINDMSPEDIAEAIEAPVETWARNCHAISLAIVKAGLVPGARVARGWCHGVDGQHSWIVDGRDCYAPKAKVIDPTLWSYVEGVDKIWRGTADKRPHMPHGAGSIWDWGQPQRGDGKTIAINTVELSPTARSFLELLGPLDRQGWMTLLSQAPVGGWPAGEIIAAAYENDHLCSLIPIDRVGMLTDINPNWLYW